MESLGDERPHFKWPQNYFWWECNFWSFGTRCQWEPFQFHRIILNFYNFKNEWLWTESFEITNAVEIEKLGPTGFGWQIEEKIGGRVRAIKFQSKYGVIGWQRYWKRGLNSPTYAAPQKRECPPPVSRRKPLIRRPYFWKSVPIGLL